MQAPVGQPTGVSLLCLSCHDGTLALDQYKVGGSFDMGSGPGYAPTDWANGLMVGAGGNVTLSAGGVPTPGSATTPTSSVSAAPVNQGYNSQGGTTVANGAALYGKAAAPTAPTTYLGTGTPKGNVPGGVTMDVYKPSVWVGTDLSKTHPISFSYEQAISNFNAQGMDSQLTMNNGDLVIGPNGILPLYQRKVECSTCHAVHNTDAFGNTMGPDLMRIDNTNQSALCLNCHRK